MRISFSGRPIFIQFIPVVEAEAQLSVGGAVEVAQADRPLLAEVGQLLLEEVPRLRARLREQLPHRDLVLGVRGESPETMNVQILGVTISDYISQRPSLRNPLQSLPRFP